MRIAIIGTGIAGNAAAYALSTSTGHDLTIYERDSRLGGHSATVDVDYDGVTYGRRYGIHRLQRDELPQPDGAVRPSRRRDAGLDDELRGVRAGAAGSSGAGVPSAWWTGSSPSAATCCRRATCRCCWRSCGSTGSAIVDRAAGLLAGPVAQRLPRTGAAIRERFRDDYLIPMGAAIWSMSPAAMLAFPAESFIAFFENHHLLQWNRPVWRTVTGGSRSYVEKISEPFRDKVRLDSEVRSRAALRVRRRVTDDPATGHLRPGDLRHPLRPGACLLADPSP